MPLLPQLMCSADFAISRVFASYSHSSLPVAASKARMWEWPVVTNNLPSAATGVDTVKPGSRS